MDWPGGKSQGQQAEPKALPRFPRIWIGYLLGGRDADCGNDRAQIASGTSQRTIAHTSFVSVSRNFISLIYWLVCVYEYHVVLAQATAGAYPLSRCVRHGSI